MQQYTHLSAEELATLPAFIGWVKHPDSVNSAVWHAWLAQHPHKTDQVQLARQLVLLWTPTPVNPPAGAQASVWTAIQARKNRPASTPPVRQHRSANAPRRRLGLAVALSFLLLLTIGLVFYGINTDITEYNGTANTPRTITLPDGSTVVLDTGASIRFAPHWSVDESRTVRLVGRAQFSVTHQPNHQCFIVQTSDALRINVLGTVFTVDQQARQTRVVLNSGRVRLQTTHQSTPVDMVPGELVDVPRDGKQPIIRRRVEPAVYSAWTSRQFMFENTTLGEMADLLMHDFGYRIEFADSTWRNRRMTIHLPTRDPAILLAAMAEANDLTVATLSPHHSGTLACSGPAVHRDRQSAVAT